MVHHFNVEIAKKYGVEEAVIIYNLAFWLMHNKANNKNYYDGYYWTYNSARAFEELFPYFNSKKISRLLNKLEELNVIKSGNYNPVAYDRTKWYTISSPELIDFYDLSLDKNEKSISQKCPMDFTKMSDGMSKSVQPIPDNKPDNKNTDKKQYIKRDLISEIEELEISDNLKAKFIEFVQYRKEIKKPLKTIRPVISEIKKLGKDYVSEQHLIDSIEESMNKEYQGIFPIKNYKQQFNTIPGFVFDQQRYDRLMRTDRCVLTDKDLRYLEKCEIYLGR